MIININNKEIELKFSLRALMMYENITEEPFNPKNTTDILTFLYCIVVSSSKDYSLLFDEFIDALDENPKLLGELTEWMNSSVSNSELLKKN